MADSRMESMEISLSELGSLVRSHRQQKGLTQATLSRECEVPVRHIGLLERGHALPSSENLERICSCAGVPDDYWKPFTTADGLRMARFETLLEGLTGEYRTLVGQPSSVVGPAASMIRELVEGSFPPAHRYGLFCSILVFYGIPRVSRMFFNRYFVDPDSPSRPMTLDSLETAIEIYQMDAMRLYSSFAEAFAALGNSDGLQQLLSALEPRDTSEFTNRPIWDVIQEIPSERLADLGYIAAERVKRESNDRQAISAFLTRVAKRLEEVGATALSEHSEAELRRMDSLLRRFGSQLDHTFLSPLFAPDPGALLLEAERLAPKEEEELAQMQETQDTALRNLSGYLVSDYLDVYIATSMRSDADFVSVNEFVSNLFSNDELKGLRLRYFNPTQSWVSDRVAKGLVEALMLKRTSYTIYMAQKSDTFGKDSEASVSLGQGKPVIVYVPKLSVPEVDLDSDRLGRMSSAELIGALHSAGVPDAQTYTDDMDKESLLAPLMYAMLERADDDAIARTAQRCWADFDLPSEANRVAAENRQQFRKWLSSVVESAESQVPSLPEELREDVRGILVAAAARFERRARIFREVHPLALQVILSQGILNGILVTRSINDCAALLSRLIENRLELELHVDEQNYRLVERRTGSTIRVISRHRLLNSAFKAGFGGGVSRESES